MNPLDAFYHTVHDYPGGVESLAPRMGMSSAVLRNKANVNCTTNKPMLEDAMKAMDLTCDLRILHSLCHRYGGVFVHVGGDAPSGDLAVLELVTHVWRSQGDVGRAVDDTLADGRVDMKELERVEAAAFELHRHVQQMIQRMREMAE